MGLTSLAIRLIKAPFKAIAFLIGAIFGFIGILLIQITYFCCFGFWVGGAAVFFGILLRLTRIFAPFGTSLMRKGFNVMFIDGETIQNWFGNDN